MNENRYDDPVFFEKYGQMARSRLGLAGAGEWETLREVLPALAGRQVLDLGCGYGWHAKYAADSGAAEVVAIDRSEKMLAVAREKNSHPAIQYQLCSFEEADFPEGSFDVVIASLMIHYLPDYGDFVEKVHRWLRPGGILVYNVEHPVFTAYGSQEWIRGQQGEILHFPVDRYFLEGERNAVFLGEHVVKYHRTLTTYLGELLANDFRLLRVEEPQPPEWMLREFPEMADELRRPMMLIVSAQKC